MKCSLCDREALKDDFCRFHVKAYENVVNNYAQWKKALEVSWKEYLREIAVNPLAGQWAREIAQHLLQTGEQPNVKVS
jgi:DNA topoisomerase-1